MADKDKVSYKITVDIERDGETTTAVLTGKAWSPLVVADHAQQTHWDVRAALASAIEGDES
jgi:hypothetical protein